MSAPTSPRTGPARHHVDSRRWPDVAVVPRVSRPRTAVARHLVRRALEALPLWTVLPGGETLGTGGPRLEIHDPDSFHRRLGHSGLIGFGESYMAREWDAPDLVGVLRVFAEHAETLVPPPLQRLRPLWAPVRPASQRNTPEGARGNIHRHYDLSNELFALFLDETLTYSSAVFRSFPPAWRDLAPAQRRKTEMLLDQLRAGPGTRLLEIGTGWGELALCAAKRGAEVVSVTLSQKQLEVARRRVEEAGFADRVTLLLRDYRQVRGSYDAIVSVEMIEAVGEEYWPVYLKALDRLLAPGGRVVLQAITMPHHRLLATRRTHTWIQKYVFPGGMIPSLRALSRIAREETRLRPAADAAFGAHYAETLRLWRERFTERADEVAALGLDDTFRRMWTLYLAYSEAGFRAGYLDVRQLLLLREERGQEGE
ncbi:class I SAM-dependent methyltransferase [Streptomyces sp. NPDC048172]|uniref:class I SAM-dependent methyltransferase n=1 Tax=Streptomyces sp. NPDC048172 TaxID=3365505 RepID=UPI00371ADA99